MPPAAAVAGAGLLGGAGVGIGKAVSGGMGTGRNDARAGAFGTDPNSGYNPNAFNVANAPNIQGSASGYKDTYGVGSVNEFNAGDTRLAQGDQALDQQGDVANMIKARAQGRDLISKRIADANRVQLGTALASDAASARGPGGIALSSANRAGAEAQGLAGIGQQEQIASEAEQRNAELAAVGAYGQVAQGRQAGAGLSYGAGGSKGNLGLGFGGLEEKTATDQTGAQIAGQQVLAGSYGNQQNTNVGVEQANAANQWNLPKMVLGGATGGAEIGASLAQPKASDPRAKQVAFDAGVKTGQALEQQPAPQKENFQDLPETHVLAPHPTAGRFLSDQTRRNIQAQEGPAPIQFPKGAQTAHGQLAEPGARGKAPSQIDHAISQLDQAMEGSKHVLGQTIGVEPALIKFPHERPRKGGDVIGPQLPAPGPIVTQYGEGPQPHFAEDKVPSDPKAKTDIVLLQDSPKGELHMQGDRAFYASAEPRATEGASLSGPMPRFGHARPEEMMLAMPTAPRATPRAEHKKTPDELAAEADRMLAMLDAQKQASLQAGPAVRPRETEEMHISDPLAKVTDNLRSETRGSVIGDVVDGVLPVHGPSPMTGPYGGAGGPSPTGDYALTKTGGLDVGQTFANMNQHEKDAMNHPGSSGGYMSDPRAKVIEDHDGEPSVVSGRPDQFDRPAHPAAAANTQPKLSLAHARGFFDQIQGQSTIPHVSDPAGKADGGEPAPNPHHNEISQTLDATPAVSYRYKSPAFEPEAQRPGERQVGFLTTDLKKTPLGAAVVETRSDGLEGYNQHRMIGLQHAEIRNLHERMRALESKLGGG